MEKDLRLQENKNTSQSLNNQSGIPGLKGRFSSLVNSMAMHRWIVPALFILIFSTGVFARIWQFNQVPPGLNQDEASIGVEAYDLLHFGMDRNGIPYPVNFISWGSGQNALYAYVLLPFIAIRGLDPFTVRLPMLLSGILSLPLVFCIGKRLFGTGFGLLGMFLLAISPWHILLSRWGLESNLLPFTFLVGYVCIEKSKADNYWFILANVFFALSLYAYGPAYAAVPVFLLLASIILFRAKNIRLKSFLPGMAVFLILGLPIGLLILVNWLKLGNIQLGIFTIPRLPAEARFQSMGAVFSKDMLKSIAHNILTMGTLLVKQSDGLVWNSVKPFGYFYTITFPLALTGIFLILPSRKNLFKVENSLLLSWLAAAVLIGALQPVNINRLNLIFIPLILCTAVPIYWLAIHWKPGFVLVLLALTIGFVAFTRVYHGAEYRSQADGAYFTNFLPALDFARQSTSGPICVTNHVNMAYIFVLFSEKMKPADYLSTIQYDDPASGFRHVLRLGRYTFGLENCPDSPAPVYILSDDEGLPQAAGSFTSRHFGRFQVLIP